jgi:Flp pilus assembly protein TadD
MDEPTEHRQGRPAPRGALLLAAALAQQGHTVQAAACFEKALSLNPRLGQTHAHLGVAQLRLGRVTGAIASLERAVQLSPENPESHDNLGLAYAAAGQVDKAVAATEQAIALATEAGRLDLADRYRAHLENYKGHRPLRETAPK